MESLFRHLGDGVALCELIFEEQRAIDYLLVDVNPAFQTHTGWTREMVVGKRASLAFGARSQFLDLFAQVTASGTPANYEAYFAPLGRRFRVAVLPLGGTGFAMVFSDVSESYARDEALKRSQVDLLRSQRVARVGSYHMDVRRGSWDCTAVLDEIFGTEEHPSHQLEEWVELLHPDDRGAMLSYFTQEVVGKQRPFDREYRIVRRSDGRTIWVHGRGELEISPEGEVVSMFGTIQDVTELRRAEEERRKLEQQVMQAKKLESLGVLAGGVAHDFNNLLTAILGNADLLLEQLAPDDRARENVRDIERASQRAAELSRQMLAYSGKGHFVVQPLSLSELVRDMTDLLSAPRGKKVRIAYDFAPGLPAVSADSTQLRQVVMNLITNATEAIGDASGTITLTTSALACDQAFLREIESGGEALPPGRYVCLEVRDDGHGMDAVTLARVFDPFFTTKFTGRGLGLAVVQGIVRGHRGGLHVSSQPGVGTSFKVLLPADDRAARPAEATGSPSARFQSQGLVLFADDEEPVRNVGRRLLERSGLRVLMASNGREALELFRQHQAEIRLVVLDMTMPELDGDACFRELRRLAPDVKVIMTSGYAEQEVIQRFVGTGLCGFVQKPFTFAELSSKLKAALDE